MSDAQFTKAERSFFNRFFALNPHLATYVGLHDPYDRMMPDGGLSAIQEGVVILKEFLESVSSLDEERLSASRRIDREVIRYAYDMARFHFEEHRVSRRNPEALKEFLSICFLMLVKDYAPLPQRLESIAARLWELPIYLGDFRSRFDGGRTVRLWTQLAMETAQNVEPFIDKLLGVAEQQDEKLGKLFAKAAAKARSALEAHRRWLAELALKTTGEWALGREKFEYLVSIRDLGMGIPEMLELGYDQLRSTQSRQKEIAKEIDPDFTVQDAVDAMMNDSPDDFTWALTHVRETTTQALQFILDKDLATVPVGGEVLVHETPDFLRSLIPYAAIFPPGKYEKNKQGVFVVTRPSDRKDLRSHYNRAEVVNMVLHEAFPGHYLQSTVSNFASETHLLANAPEVIEGWAHYAEQLALDRGFNDNAMTRLAQVRAMTWRAARLIVDIGLSCKDMSFDEGVRFFIVEAGLDQKNAEAEVRRCTLFPGYSLSYLVGKHLILRLKAKRKSMLGPRYAEKEFHDTICANGYLPFRLLTKVFEGK